MRMWFFLLLFPLSLLANDWSVETMRQMRKPNRIAIHPHREEIVIEVIHFRENQAHFDLYLKSRDSLSLLAENGKMPAYSPDGIRLAFVQKGRLMVYEFDRKKMRSLTDFDEPVVEFAWSPNGDQIAFIKPDDTPSCAITDSLCKAPSSHLWVISTNGHVCKRLTQGSFHIGSPLISSPISWSPCGRELLCPFVEENRADLWDQVSLVRVRTRTGRVIPCIDAPAFKPHYSPDGKWIAYVGNKKGWGFVQDVYVVDREGGCKERLCPTFNRQIGVGGDLLGWSADSEHLYVVDSNKTKTELLALAMDGSAPNPINVDETLLKATTLDSKAKRIAYVAESSHLPPEVYLHTLGSNTTQQMTKLNERLPPIHAHTTKIQWVGEEKLPIEGLLTRPSNWDEKTPLPLLLVIHGGPTWHFRESYLGSLQPYPLAVFAERGFAILRCNVRGSTGYGKQFRLANQNDWGGGDFLDLMDGVDHLIRQGIVDPDRMGVMGWSYGGYLAAWTITQTSRFQAASVGAGFINLVSFTGTSDIPSFLPFHFKGELWDRFGSYVERSPITHARQIKTPTLVQHGRLDFRVMATQGLELYESLRRQGVETELMLFEGEGHILRNPLQIEKAASANLDWFETHLQ